MKRWSFVFLALVALCCGGCKKTRAQVEAEQVSQACAKHPVTGAKPYVQGTGPHPIMVFESLRSDKYMRPFGRLTSKTPVGRDRASTELALCIERPVEQELETCQFGRQLRVGFVRVPGARVEGPSFPRVVISKKARIVAVASGETVAEKAFEGSAPPGCDHSIVGHPSAGDFRGGEVSDLEIDMWAESYALGQKP